MIYFIQEEFDNYSGRHRFQHDRGISLLEYGLLKEFGLKNRPFEFTKGEHGKPYLAAFPQICFNISHCPGLTACCVSDCNIGLDAEKIRPYRDRTAQGVLSYDELLDLGNAENKQETFFRFWTLKESFLKQTGKGLTFPMKDISFKLKDNGDIECNIQGYQFSQYRLWETFLITVCVEQEQGRRNSFYSISAPEMLPESFIELNDMIL